MNHPHDPFAAYTGDRQPGLALAVWREGVPVFVHGAGVAHMGTGEWIQPTTNFRLASVSKQFTAALILGLAADGRLALDAPIRAFLPELPAFADEVRIVHLLQHTSGLPDYEDLVSPTQFEPIQDLDVVRLLEQSSLLFFPAGTNFRYSNTGYVLLGLIAARAAGLPLPDAFRERLFAPLGLNRTLAFVAGGPPVPERAYGHSFTDGRPRVTDQSVTSATLGDGGIYSSLDDLGRWCDALDRASVPGWSEVARAFEPLALPNLLVAPYGMGWEVRRWAGHPIHSHSGSTLGFRNCLARFPAQRLSVAILTNRSNPIPAELLAAVLERHLPDWNSFPESILLCQQIVGLRPMDRHARPHLESRHAP